MDPVYTIIQLADATIRMATPLLLACLAGLFSERAGIFDIGLEGKMLAAAFLSAAVSFSVGPVLIERFPTYGQMIHPVWIGLAAGIAISVVLSIIHGLAAITFRGNQLISGVAINFLAAGLTVVIAGGWFGQAGRTPSLSGTARFDGIDFPGAFTRIRDMRDASPGMQFYSELMSGHSILVYIAFLAVPLSWWVLYRTRFGLRLRAVGENPAAVDTAGISVVQLRFSAVIICGVLCGIAGAYLSTAVQAGFTKDMTANRGFIALAALIFAKWRPVQAMGACLLFGFFFAIEARFSTISVDAIWIIVALLGAALLLMIYALRRDKIDIAVLGGLSVVLVAIALMTLMGAAQAEDVTLVTSLFQSVRIPNEFITSLPYILTVVILAGFVGKAIPPRAGGEPYVKER